MDLDPIDLRIIAELQRDARLTNVDLAAAVGLSPSPCLRRVKRLEQSGVIASYKTVVDRRLLGFSLTVFVALRVERHSRGNADMLQSALEAVPEIVTCHMVSGTSDFIAEVVVRDLAHYETLLNERLLTLPMVTAVRSNFSLRRIKSDGLLDLATWSSREVDTGRAPGGSAEAGAKPARRSHHERG